MVTGLLIAIAIILVVIVFAGSQVSAFVNDIFVGVGVDIRDSETRIPPAVQGEIVCDLFITANWEIQNTIIFAIEPQPVIFFDPDDIEGGGVGITTNYDDCKVSGGILSFLPLFDFLSTSDTVPPLDFIIPDFGFFDIPYELDWILVDENTGKERKLSHYQNISYEVPAGQFDFRFEQKLVFRDIVPDDYILKIVPEVARFFEQDDGEAFFHLIPDPTN